MPRLVPRLLQRLQSHLSKQPIIKIRPRSKTPHRPATSPPPTCPPLSPKGRTQSIILDSLHPIMSISKFRRHKEPYAPLRVHQRLKTHIRDRDRGLHPVRVMSEEERTLWASPYRASLRLFVSVANAQRGGSPNVGHDRPILCCRKPTYALWCVCVLCTEAFLTP